MKDPANYDARAEIQWLASVAHNGILDTGRAADWGSHRIEHEISAQYGITHGEGMAVVLVAWCKYMAEVKPYKLAQLAKRVFDIDPYIPFNNYIFITICVHSSLFIQNFDTIWSQANGIV